MVYKDLKTDYIMQVISCIVLHTDNSVESMA